MLKSIVASLAVIVLTGCSTYATFKPRSYTPENRTTTQLIASPAAGVESEIEIGKSLISITKKFSSPAVRLAAPFEHGGGYSAKHSYYLTIQAGDLLAVGKDAEGVFYKSSAPIQIKYWHKPSQSMGKPEEWEGGVYVPNDPKKRAEVYWLWGDEKVAQTEPTGNLLVIPLKKEWYGEGGFVRELIYTGIAQNTLSVHYNEFLGDTTRPAVSQDLKYDLSQSKVVGYKQARFEVIKATNTSLRYKVIQPLD